MRAIIATGDRYAGWPEWGVVVDRTLNALMVNEGLVVIHGGANGIDQIAGSVANESHYGSDLPMLAQWKLHGKKAGPMRNAAMLRVLQELEGVGYRIAVYAFHNNLAGSKGTKDMVEQAQAAGVPTFLFRSTGEQETL